MTKPTTPKNQNTGKGSISNGITGNRVTADIRAWDPDRKIIHKSVIEGSKNQAARLFNVLSKGHRVHRRNCDKFGFVWNGPVHSWVGTLEKMYDVPVTRCWMTIETDDGPVRVVEYWFDDRVIEMLDDLLLREQLAEATRRGRESGYLKKSAKAANSAVDVVAEFPVIGAHHPEQMTEWVELAHRILESAERVKHEQHTR